MSVAAIRRWLYSIAIRLLLVSIEVFAMMQMK